MGIVASTVCAFTAESAWRVDVNASLTKLAFGKKFAILLWVEESTVISGAVRVKTAFYLLVRSTGSRSGLRLLTHRLLRLFFLTLFFFLCFYLLFTLFLIISNIVLLLHFSWLFVTFDNIVLNSYDITVCVSNDNFHSELILSFQRLIACSFQIWLWFLFNFLLVFSRFVVR